MDGSEKYVILASDGLWDVMTPEEAVQIVDKFGTMVMVNKDLANTDCCSTMNRPGAFFVLYGCKCCPHSCCPREDCASRWIDDARTDVVAARLCAEAFT